jgi:BA14K-like protein
VIGRFQDEGLSRCAAQFRSFEPDTGYYTTYAGERVLCPYLQ